MTKNLNDIIKTIGKITANLSNNFDTISQSDIDEIASELAKVNKSMLENKNRSEEKVRTQFFTAQEMADYLDVDRETIYRWCEGLRVHKNKRGCPKLGNSYRFTKEDVKLFESYITNKASALCITNTIYFNPKKRDTALFSKGAIYSIVKENNRWCYLLNKDWSGTFRISKKQFKKNFSVEGEIDYDARKYNLISKEH